jgi:hypothetical protein
MSYRNLKVEDIDYKYIVGRSYVKIRSLDDSYNVLVDKNKIGSYEDERHTKVSPGMVAEFIRTGKVVNAYKYV